MRKLKLVLEAIPIFFVWLFVGMVFFIRWFKNEWEISR